MDNPPPSDHPPFSIMFDMDGVLADFVASCASLFAMAFPRNPLISTRVRSYTFWRDDWSIPHGDRLISDYCHEVFAYAPPISQIVRLARNLPDGYTAEIVSHLWGGDDPQLQETCLLAKQLWLTRHGLGHLPLRPVRGETPTKTGNYDVIIEDHPDNLMRTDALGHERSLRILVHRGWQPDIDSSLADDLNLVVLRPHRYSVLDRVLELYFRFGRPAWQIQLMLDGRIDLNLRSAPGSGR